MKEAFYQAKGGQMSLTDKNQLLINGSTPNRRFELLTPPLLVS